MKKKRFFAQRRGMTNRVLSLVLVLAMVATLLQTVPGSLLTVWATESETGQERSITESDQVTIKIHYKNTETRWNEVHCHAWPAEQLIKWDNGITHENAEHPGYYTIDITKKVEGGLDFLFYNGSWGNGNQTGNLNISQDALKSSDGVYECWVCNGAVSATPPDGWDPPFISPEVNGREVTFRYKDATAQRVRVAGSFDTSGNSWNMLDMTNSGGVFSYTRTLEPGVYDYKFIVGEDGWINDPSNDKWGTGGNSRLVVPGVISEPEIGIGDTTPLPVSLTIIDASGSETSWTDLTYSIKTPVDGVSIESNKITVDDKCTTKSVELTATDGKVSYDFTAAITGTPTISPEVSGNSVTFRFKDDAGKTVSVAGVMTGWALKAMTEKDGIYSCTVEDLKPGSYEYKFVVDGSWIADPRNPFPKVGNDKNSVFYIAGLEGQDLTAVKGKQYTLPAQLSLWEEKEPQPGEKPETKVDVTYSDPSLSGVTLSGDKLTVSKDYAGSTVKLTATDGNNHTADVTVKLVEDNNKITVKLHYERTNGDYDGWNVWAWAEGKGGSQYDYVASGNEMIAEIEATGRSISKLGYRIRKGDWEEKDVDADRFIDLSNVLSGTVHYYVKQGQSEGWMEFGEDVLTGVKIVSANYDKSKKQIVVVTGTPVAVAAESAFKVSCADGTELTVKSVSADGNEYTLSLQEDISSIEAMIKSYFVSYTEDADYEYPVIMPDLYTTEEFESKYTYTGNDLGANWTKEKTTFKVWAPTAETVKVKLYASGTMGTDDCTETLTMTMNAQGVWSAEKSGDLNGTYYTYEVTVQGKTTEACDPYARTTGVNGKRAMVIDLDSTNPADWDEDVSPNKGMTYTDSIIYELHVRDFSINENSGITNKGKFLGLTEKGTVSTGGQTTGLDYLENLGVTHIHLLPSYDYGSVDETKLDTPQYNWGYDPVNYNVPEGSYSTDPYKGEVRVKEMKEMVKALHDSNINVIMDVVYNHVYDADSFSFNQLVPKYFSRTNADGSYSNGSGCGNDTASERAMVRKYIVDSVNYWADEYHIDGFRFDLVGLLDADTINEIVKTVHENHPDVVFYGEGWTMDTAVSKPGTTMATQANSTATPNFAYFSDTIRDLLKGGNDETSLGFVSGLTGQEEPMAKCFTATTSWCHSPIQTVNYASCHDNYTLKDKLNVTRKDASEEDRIKMNNLAAAIYLTAEGIPLIHAGEELLRTKVDESGKVIHNSYNSSDYVNSIKWADLKKTEVQEVRDYYKGLIEFRKNHAALRLTTAADVAANVKYKWITSEVIMFVIDGTNVEDEVSDGIVVIFNATTSAKEIDLYASGREVPKGDWQICVNDKNAGIEVLDTVTDGKVTVAPISAMILVNGETEDTDSVYVKNSIRPVTAVSLNKETLALKTGATTTLTATVTPNNATCKEVTWASSDEDVATVDETGKVTAVSAGTAMVTVTAKDGSDKSASCEVTVSDPDPDEVLVSKIELDQTTLALETDETATITATVTPDNATNKAVTWTSSDETVVTVDASGKVTAVSAGTATVTATAKDGSGKSASCEVTVSDPDPDEVLVSKIELDQTTLALETDETATITATVTPDNATNKAVTWTSSKPDVVTVDENGKVTAVSAGTATVTATAKDGSGKSASCEVTVSDPIVLVSKIELNKTELTLKTGATTTLTATVTPDNATDKAITWTSSDETVVTVDASGKVTAVSAGTATITATAKDGSGVSASCAVAVSDLEINKVPVSKIELNKTELTLKTGATETLTATVTPDNATDKAVTWASSDENIVTVDANGKVTAASAGTATVTVTAKDGSEKSASCKVTVSDPKPDEVLVSNIELDKTTLELKTGDTEKITATVTPDNATKKDVTWASSKPDVVTVDQKGNVTAVAAGTATVTATAKDGSGKSASCEITVTEKVVTDPGDNNPPGGGDTENPPSGGDTENPPSGGDTGNNTPNTGNTPPSTGNNTNNNGNSGSGNQTPVAAGNVVFDGVAAEESYQVNGRQMKRFRSTNGSEISVVGEASVLPSGLRLHVELLQTSAESYKKAADAVAKLSVIGNYRTFDVSLKDGSGVEIHQLNGYVEVIMPIPEGINRTRVVVYRVEDNGSLTKCDSSVNNNYVTFRTNHFSTYVIAEAANAAPQTSDVGATRIGFGVLLLLSGIAAFCMAKRRKLY